MTFSIIIPAYNAEAFLPRCLNSIFSQEYDDYEVLCINDGSTDSTSAILECYAITHNNLKILTQSNQGMASARNHGLNEATGDYVVFVDSDDWLCDNALSTLASQLTGEDIIGFNARKYHEASGKYTYRPTVVTPESATGWDYYCRHRLDVTDIHFVCIWQRAYRRTFLEEHDLHFAEGLRRAEDDLFTTLAMLHVASIKTIPDCLYTYTIRPDSITHTIAPALEADSLHVQRLLEDTFLPLEGIDKRAIYQVLASNYITRLTNHRNTALTADEWHRFHTICVTPRHHRLYRLARIHPAMLRLYNNLCSSLH